MKIISIINDYIHTHCKKSKNKFIPKNNYREGKYKISNHAVQRMNERKITKGELHIKLYTTPIKITNTKLDSMRRPSYNRLSKNKISTSINPNTNVVTTTKRFHTKEYLKLIKEKK